MEVEVNYWAVLVCGVASMLVGFLWYGPLFSKSWAKEMGWDLRNAEQVAKMKKSANVSYPQAFIGALLMAFVFAHILEAFDTDSVSLGLQGALWTWLGLIVPVKYSDKLWGGKSLNLFFIDSFYYLAQLAVFAVILTLWA